MTVVEFYRDADEIQLVSWAFILAWPSDVKNFRASYLTSFDVYDSHRDLISHLQRVHSFRAAGAGTKSSVLVQFGYAQTALNADATF